MKDMLMKFIEKTGKDGEFALFLEIFKSLPKMKFAVIKISGKVLEDQMDAIAEDLAYLHKLGIYPIIVHGAGSALDRKLPASKKIDGLRYTSKDDMKIVEQVFSDAAYGLADKINEAGGSAEVAEKIFTCTIIEGLGSVGSITEIDLDGIKKIIDQNKIPIISPIGAAPCGKVNINADTAAKELVKALEPKKFILLTETGGILDKDSKIIPFLNLPDDDLSNLSGGMLLKVNEIKDFISSGIETAVVITSAQNLFKELFTVKGSGTYIQYYVIKSSADMGSLDMEKIKIVLEDAFGKKLIPDYFSTGISDVIYEKGYDGVAIIKKVGGIPYLDKLAVARHCQGTGLGKSLWLAVTKKYPKLIWRAAVGNPVNEFYAKNSDGFIKNSEWKAYWINLSPDEILPAVEEVLKKEKTII